MKQDPVKVVTSQEKNTMKNTHSPKHSPSCSCSNCIYDPKDPGILNGNKIDKLYYEQYLPLREKKLLDKLVRTRGIYDDIRNRILSSSSVDLIKNNDYEFNNSTELENSRTVHSLVDLVDRGAYPTLHSSVNLHSDCCRCCRCRPKYGKHHRVHMHIPSQEHIDRYKRSISETIIAKKKKVRIGNLGPWSEQCMCALKFWKSRDKPRESITKTQSKDKVTHKKTAKNTNARALNKIVCKCPLATSKHSISRKSNVVLKNAKHKTQESLLSIITKANNVFRIKKDSLMIYRDQLKKKKEIKAWTCAPGYCIPHKCIPELCLKKLQKRNQGKLSHGQHNYISKTHVDAKTAVQHGRASREKRNSQTQIPRKQYKNTIIGDNKPKIIATASNSEEIFVPSRNKLKRCFCTKLSSQVQNQQNSKRKPFTKPTKLQIMTSKMNATNDTVIKKSSTARNSKINCKCEEEQSLSSQTKNTQAKENVTIRKKQFAEPNKNTTGHANTIEIVTSASKSRMFSSTSNTLERCFCTKTSSQEQYKQNPQKQHLKKPTKEEFKTYKTAMKNDKVICKCETKDNSSSTHCKCKVKNSSSQTNKHQVKKVNTPVEHKVAMLLPYECEPAFCVPGACDSFVCLDRIKQRLNNHNIKSKYTDSPKIHTPEITSVTHRDQYNEISPTFKQDSPQYKHLKKPKGQIKPPKVIVKNEEATEKNSKIICKCVIKEKNSSTQTKKTKIKENVQAGATLVEHKDMLLPYECEPAFCVPGECDPLVCSDRIKQRFNNHNIRSKYTDSPKIHTPEITSITHRDQYNEISPTFKQDSPQYKHLKKPKGQIKPPKVTVKNEEATEKNSKIICKCVIKEKNSSTQTKKTKVKENIQAGATLVEHKNMSLPYECEPTFCVPGECDPFVCLDRFKQRYMNKKIKSSYTDNPKVSRKPKITSLSDTIPPHREIHTHNIPRQRKRPQKPKLSQKPVAEKSISSPDAKRKQVVRIGSSFKFEIELFKEKNYPDTLENTNTGNTNKGRKDSIEKKSANKSSNKVHYHHDETNSISSYKQAPTNKEHALLEPFIKKCFCSLKLHKKPKQRLKSKHKKLIMTSSEISKPDSISVTSQASMTTAVVNYVLPPSTYAPNLLPYECEPFFCTPGRCDPIVCDKRIRARNLKAPKAVHREINTDHLRSTQTITSKSETSNTTTTTKAHKQRDKSKSAVVRPQADTAKSAPATPQRQAVKISSNFGFDIEFYKNKSQNERVTNFKEEIPSKEQSSVIKKVKNHTRNVKDRGIGENNKTHLRDVGNKGIELNKQHMNTQISNNKSSKLTVTTPLKRCFCTLKFQKKPKTQKNITKKIMTNTGENYEVNEYKNIDTQTKKIPKAYVKPPERQRTDLLPYECEPNFCTPGLCDPIICQERLNKRNKLLRRCFCTLKFRSSKDEKINQNITDKTEAPSVKSIGTETNIAKYHKKSHLTLLPYECEPGICEPGNCNPYECEKLIKKRNMVTSTRQTDRPNQKSSSSEAKHRNRDRYSQSLPSQTVLPKKDKKVKAESRTSNLSLNDYSNPVSSKNSRQSVKIGSAFSFNIEFFKTKSQPEHTIVSRSHSKSNIKKVKSKRSKNNKINTKVKSKPMANTTNKNRTRDTTTENMRHDRSSSTQANQAPQKDKSSNVESRPNRCFCTLKLHKRGKNNRLGDQQAYFLQNTEFPIFLKGTSMGPREGKPCLCIARTLQQ